MTPAWTALQQGFRLARQARSAVWVLFLPNLALACLAAFPIYRGILAFTGQSLASQQLAAGFSPDWLTDFSFTWPGSLNRYAVVIAFFGLLSIPVNSVLAGGVLARFRGGADWAGDTKRYAGRLLRLMLLGLILYWIVFRLVHQALGGAVSVWTRDWLDDRPVFALRFAVSVLTLLGLAFINLVMDFARVKLVMEDGASAVQALLGSLGFSLKRRRHAALVYLLPLLGGAGLLLLYRLLFPWPLVDASLATASRYREPITLALLFFAQQVIVFGRYWLRVAGWASEWSYYQDAQSKTPWLPPPTASASST